MLNRVANRKTSFPVLGMLTWRPMSVYEIKTQIEGSLANFWSESFGQLYPQLAALEAAGLVRADPTAPSGRGKKVYRITAEGRRHLADWLNEPPASRPPRNELLMKVFFADEGDLASIIIHVRASMEEAAATLARYQKIEADLMARAATRPRARLWLLTVRNGIAHAKTHQAWCADALADLQTLEETPDDAD